MIFKGYVGQSNHRRAQEGRRDTEGGVGRPKADPECNLADLTSAERAVAASSLEGRFPLPALLARLGFPKRTYYYQLECMTRPKVPDWLGDAAEGEFRAEHCSRGYRIGVIAMVHSEPMQWSNWH